MAHDGDMHHWHQSPGREYRAEPQTRCSDCLPIVPSTHRSHWFRPVRPHISGCLPIAVSGGSKCANVHVPKLRPSHIRSTLCNSSLLYSHGSSSCTETGTQTVQVCKCERSEAVPFPHPLHLQQLAIVLPQEPQLYRDRYADVPHIPRMYPACTPGIPYTSCTCVYPVAHKPGFLAPPRPLPLNLFKQDTPDFRNERRVQVNTFRFRNATGTQSCIFHSDFSTTTSPRVMGASVRM